MIKGNRGEWSEVYVLCKLLGDTVLLAGDENFSNLQIKYPIIKILRSNKDDDIIYSINNNVVHISVNNESVLQLSTSEFTKQAIDILSSIKKSQDTTFEIPSVEHFLDSIKCSVLKAKSNDKTDISIQIYDHRTSMEPLLGFSIKSRLGGQATLVNASGSTSIVYRIDGLSNSKISTIKDEKIQVSSIHELGGIVQFSHFESDTFMNNLQLIDDGMPDIIASIVKYYYIFRISSIESLIKKLSQDNPRDYKVSNLEQIYSYKMKKFLIDSALGMKPKTPWSGTYDANGGYIIVREDGEIICYHIYNRNFFENYLIKHTKMDTPSTSRHKFGQVYETDGQWWIKLNFQIRFT